ncbi:MAG: hypothetical protein ACRDSF_22925 [Pseudonocardiaceae bacterium]
MLREVNEPREPTDLTGKAYGALADDCSRADTERWPEAAENAAVLGSVLLLPAVFVTVVVAALPRRNVRRAGARSNPFLFSRTSRVVELMPRVGKGNFVMGGSEVLDEGVSCPDHLR